MATRVVLYKGELDHVTSLLEAIPRPPSLFQVRAKVLQVPEPSSITTPCSHCALSCGHSLTLLSSPASGLLVVLHKLQALTSLGALSLLFLLFRTLLYQLSASLTLLPPYSLCSNVSFSRGQTLFTLLKSVAFSPHHSPYLIYSAQFSHSAAHLPLFHIIYLLIMLVFNSSSPLFECKLQKGRDLYVLFMGKS